MRTIAAGDYAQACRVADWPLVEMLLAYLARARELALAEHRHRELVWAALAPHVEKGKRQKPPELPEILKG